MSFQRGSVVNRGTRGSSWNVNWERESSRGGGRGGGSRRQQGGGFYPRSGRGGRNFGYANNLTPAGGHAGDIEYWRGKLEADRKLVTFQIIQPFRRVGVFCHPHWSAGLTPITKFVVQDLFETLLRILDHHSAAQLNMGWSNGNIEAIRKFQLAYREFLDHETRARAGSL